MAAYFILIVAATQLAGAVCFYYEGQPRAAAAWGFLAVANVFFAQLGEK